MSLCSLKLYYYLPLFLILSLLSSCDTITKSTISNSKPLKAPIILAGLEGIDDIGSESILVEDVEPGVPLLEYYPRETETVKKNDNEVDPIIIINEVDPIIIINEDDSVSKISSSNSDFFTYVAKDDIEAVIAYAKANTNALTIFNDNGMNGLHVAALHGSVLSAQYLINQGIKVNGLDNSKLLAIDYAIIDSPISYRHAQIVKMLIANKTNSPTTSRQYDYLFSIWPKNNYLIRFDFEQTALHIALEYSQIGIAQLLIEEGMNIITPNQFGQQAIHSAVLSGNPAVVDLVLLKGASLEARDNNDATALHTAFNITNPKEMISYLINKGSNVNAINSYNNSPLMMTAIWNLDSSVAKILLSAGARINDTNESGSTTIYQAVERNNSELALYLMDDAKANYRIKNIEGHSPLSAALANGMPSLNWFDRYINVTEKDDGGNLPLHIASFIGAPSESINYLISKGAKLNVQNNLGQSPLHIALLQKNDSLSIDLIRRGADLFTEDNRAQPDIILLLSADISVIKQAFEPMPSLPGDKDGNSALHYAIISNKNAVIDYFIMTRPIEIKRTNYLGQAALHLAAYYDNDTAILALIKAGADINLMDNRGDTALEIAIRQNSTKARVALAR